MTQSKKNYNISKIQSIIYSFSLLINPLLKIHHYLFICNPSHTCTRILCWTLTLIRVLGFSNVVRLRRNRWSLCRFHFNFSASNNTRCQRSIEDPGSHIYGLISVIIHLFWTILIN